LYFTLFNESTCLYYRRIVCTRMGNSKCICNKRTHCKNTNSN